MNHYSPMLGAVYSKRGVDGGLTVHKVYCHVASYVTTISILLYYFFQDPTDRVNDNSNL